MPNFPHLLTNNIINALNDRLQTLLPQALIDQKTQQPELIGVDPPKDYYIYEGAIGYRTPAVFIVAERIDFRKAELGANFLNYRCRVNVTAVIEERIADRLYHKAYIYQSALHSVLDQVVLTYGSPEQKMVSVVQTAEFSPLLSNVAKDPNGPSAVFRKEVSLQVDVFAYEPNQPTTL